MCPQESEIRLLLVDDEREFLEAVAPALGRRGFRVTAAEDGTAALELLRAHCFDVAVLDVKMPGIDGVELFHHIRHALPELPVVLLTGHGSIQQAFETSREGLEDYLTKPCDVEQLARVVRDAASRRRITAAPVERLEEEIRLLLVDDESDFVASVIPPLRRRGMVVSAVYDGFEALELARERLFDVAVIDVVMPGMDGLTLLDRLREADPLLEVIILTGNPEVRDVRRGLRQGAFDYLTKPCGMEDLTRVIRAAFERRNAHVVESRQLAAEAILAQRPD